MLTLKLNSTSEAGLAPRTEDERSPPARFDPEPAQVVVEGTQMSIAASYSGGGSKKPSVGVIAFAGSIGAVIEWYDFLIYGTASALVFKTLFFSNIDPKIGTLAVTVESKKVLPLNNRRSIRTRSSPPPLGVEPSLLLSCIPPVMASTSSLKARSRRPSPPGRDAGRYARRRSRASRRRRSWRRLRPTRPRSRARARCGRSTPRPCW